MSTEGAGVPLPPEGAPAGEGPPPVLPPEVRAALLDLAAAVLGGLPAEEVPAPLRRVRAFTPQRRARAGAGPLGVALERDAGFRHRVAAAWRDSVPELAEALSEGQLPPAVPPSEVVTGLYLLRPRGWVGHLLALVAASEHDRSAGRGDGGAGAGQAPGPPGAGAETQRLREQLRAERARSAELEEELASARREARRARADADRARSAARAAEADAVQARRGGREELDAALEAVRDAQARAVAAEEQATQARRTVREGRVLADARLRLLLDTVVEAAAGLRRELALPPAALRPADVVAAGEGAAVPTGSAGGEGAPGGRGLAPEDPTVLAELLTLPQAHLVVDGYNVTKAGYGTLPLLEQRRRLVEALGVLTARTAAEATCVFDGADVEARGAARVRGVRVLFSDPGVSADEVVRRIVRAEPAGRPVVVVSSDREVVSGVRAAGAYAVPSAALLRLLARG